MNTPEHDLNHSMVHELPISISDFAKNERIKQSFKIVLAISKELVNITKQFNEYGCQNCEGCQECENIATTIGQIKDIAYSVHNALGAAEEPDD